MHIAPLMHPKIVHFLSFPMHIADSNFEPWSRSYEPAMVMFKYCTPVSVFGRKIVLGCLLDQSPFLENQWFPLLLVLISNEHRIFLVHKWLSSTWVGWLIQNSSLLFVKILEQGVLVNQHVPVNDCEYCQVHLRQNCLGLICASIGFWIPWPSFPMPSLLYPHLLQRLQTNSRWHVFQN